MKLRLLLSTLVVGFILFSGAAETYAQALTGNKTVGTGGDYATLAAAIADVNAKGVSGTLTLLIDSDLAETGSSEILTTTLTGNNKLVIKPNTGKTPTVTFSSVSTSGNNSNSGLAITGAATTIGNITIDGSNTANGTTKDMTFVLNDGTAGRYAIRLNADVDDVTIKNLKITAGAIMATSASGSRTYGLYCSSSSTAAQDRLTVTNCEIGSATAAFYYAIYKPDGGTYPYGANLTISNNILFAQHKGISVWGCDGTSSINNNTVSIIGHPTGAYVQNSINGIYVETWKGTVNIFNNKVVTLKAKVTNQTTAKALYGIIVYYAAATGNTNQTANVYNNFISDFTYNGDAASATYEVIGLVLDATDQVINAYFNTIYMSGVTTNPVYGIRIYDDAGLQANIKNNIVVNTVNQNNAYAIYCDPIVNNALKTSDYNDFVVTGSNANVGYYNGAKYAALADWKTITGKDANSISINPANPLGGAGMLTSVTDLHWVSKPAAAFGGTPIPGFTTDIDGETRNGTKPYMGADEGASLVRVEKNSDVLPDAFVLKQNYPNPFNPSTVISFDIRHEGMTVLKIYDSLGREVKTLINERLSPGSYSVKFSATGLASGVYLYRLTTGAVSETKSMMLLK